MRALPILVVKVGTSTLLTRSERPSKTFDYVAESIRDLRVTYRIVLVTSGAIGFGVTQLGLEDHPETPAKLQALCMMGQVGLLRRWRAPETMIYLMVVGYRMLFVLAEAKRDIAAAQAARQGYASLSRSWRSVGILFGALAVDVWCRAADLHAAAQARNGDGPLRFLERPWPAARRELCIAALAAATLLAGVLFHRGVG